MQILKNVKRMVAATLSVVTCLTPSLFVSADGGTNKAITVQMGSSNLKQLPLVYNDDYFDKSAFEYNKSLATASLALELSGFADRSDYTDQAKNAKKALGELGFGDIKENDDYKQKTTADSIGVVAANKKITSNGEEYTLIPVVIRGGGYENEWAGNAKVGKLGDHEGFSTAATKAKEFVDNYIRDNKNIQGKVKLWIVGYSRGGATASLLGVKFNNDFTDILKTLNIEKKDSSDEDYYNDYVNRETKRTLEKYKKEIEINPNDLYVYTFEAPKGMSMDMFNGSGVKEYKGNIPRSKAEKSDRAIYTNIHNTINDDDFVTKVAPESWSFARPGVDHKLLEGRKSDDIKDMESILNEFLINKVGEGKKVKYVGNSLLAKPKSLKTKIVNYFAGFKDFSSLGNSIINTFDRAIGRARDYGENDKWNMTNREYYVDKYQGIISKLAVAVMSNMSAFESAKSDILINCKNDVKNLIDAFKVNTNNMDIPFNNIMDRFSDNMKIPFSQDERKALLNLLKGADQYEELPVLLYCLLNKSVMSNIFKMHEPELHLATLISKDDNKQLYIDQMKKIYCEYCDNRPQKMQNELEKSEFELVDDCEDEELVEIEDLINDFCQLEKEDKKEEDKKDEKGDFIDDFCQLEKEDEKEDKKEDLINSFIDLDCSGYGINQILDFEKKQKDAKKSNSKGVIKIVVGKFGKGLKTGCRAVVTPLAEGKNALNSTKNYLNYMFGGLWEKK